MASIRRSGRFPALPWPPAGRINLTQECGAWQEVFWAFPVFAISVPPPLRWTTLFAVVSRIAMPSPEYSGIHEPQVAAEGTE
jgi:hypothetical protein